MAPCYLVGLAGTLHSRHDLVRLRHDTQGEKRMCTKHRVSTCADAAWHERLQELLQWASEWQGRRVAMAHLPMERLVDQQQPVGKHWRAHVPREGQHDSGQLLLRCHAVEAGVLLW